MRPSAGRGGWNGKDGRTRTLSYFATTFAITWSIWWAAAQFPPDSWERVPLLMLGTFTPGLVAVAWTFREKGSAGVSALLKKLVQWDAPLRWYVFAFLFWAAVKLAAALLARAVSGSWPPFLGEPLYIMVMGTLASWLFFGQSGEEVGWRGFALPRLAEKMGLARASLLLGVVWEAWHLPLFYMKGADNTGQPFLLAVIIVTAISVVMAWLWWKTNGSLALTMLIHAAINNTGMVVVTRSAPVDPMSLHATTTAWMMAIVAWIFAGYLLTRLPARP